MKKTLLLTIILFLTMPTMRTLACGGTSTTVCAGSTVSLSNFYGGTWSSSNTSIATVSSTGVVGGVAAGSVTITNTYRTMFGTTTATTSVTISGVPTGVSATASSTNLCAGARLTLTGGATGATSYSWAGPGGSSIASASSENAYVSSTTSGNTGVYTLSATNSCGTTRATSSAVTVASGVPTSVAATASPNGLCVGGTLTLTGNATGAVSYSWAGPSGGASISSPTSENTNITAVRTANAGIYTMTATNACGSAKATSSSISLTTSTPASVSASASPATLCAGSSLTLTGSASGATSYSWAGPAGGAAISSASSASASVSAVTTANAGVYTLTATNSCGSVATTSASITVVSGAPTGVTATASPTNLCSGATLSLTGSATNAATYVWVAPGGSNVGSAASTSITSVTTSNTGAYVLKATNICGTTTATTSTVSVGVALPGSVSASGPTGQVCTGSSFTLAGSATGATSYSWSGPSGGSLGSTSTENPTISAATTGDAGTYTFSATNSCGTTTATVAVAVDQSPSVSGTVDNVKCNGWSDGDIYLGNIAISVTSPSGSFSCVWSNGATSTYGNWGLSAGTYSVTVTDGNGCSTTDAFTVTQPAPITATAVVTSSIGDSTGAVALVVSGGTAPYTYTWSNGSTGTGVTGLAPGDYCVAVSDSNSCSFNDCYYVSDATTGERKANTGSATTNSIANIVPVNTAYPNPFSTTSNISFTATADGHTTIDVYNAVNGQKVATLFNNDTKNGTTYTCILDGANLESGLYIYKIASENSTYTGKVTLVK